MKNYHIKIPLYNEDEKEVGVLEFPIQSVLWLERLRNPTRMDVAPDGDEKIKAHMSLDCATFHPRMNPTERKKI